MEMQQATMILKDVFKHQTATNRQEKHKKFIHQFSSSESSLHSYNSKVLHNILKLVSLTEDELHAQKALPLHEINVI